MSGIKTKKEIVCFLKKKKNEQSTEFVLSWNTKFINWLLKLILRKKRKQKPSFGAYWLQINAAALNRPTEQHTHSSERFPDRTSYTPYRVRKYLEIVERAARHKLICPVRSPRKRRERCGKVVWKTASRFNNKYDVSRDYNNSANVRIVSRQTSREG